MSLEQGRDWDIPWFVKFVSKKMQKSNINQNIMACGMEKLSVQRCDKIYYHKDRNRVVCHKYDASRWMCLAVKAQGPPRRPSTNLRK